MDEQKWNSNTMEGNLPASAPLANPYVPFQREAPPRYEARTGLIRGTMYPGLDLPFLGMQNEKELAVTPLSELQVLAFALQDLALYLDTHREDAEALEVYRAYQQIYHKAQEAYPAPLTHTMPGNADGYAWLSDPWPWEYQHD